MKSDEVFNSKHHHTSVLLKSTFTTFSLHKPVIKSQTYLAFSCKTQSWLHILSEVKKVT